MAASQAPNAAASRSVPQLAERGDEHVLHQVVDFLAGEAGEEDAVDQAPVARVQLAEGLPVAVSGGGNQGRVVAVGHGATVPEIRFHVNRVHARVRGLDTPRIPRRASPTAAVVGEDAVRGRSVNNPRWMTPYAPGWSGFQMCANHRSVRAPALDIRAVRPSPRLQALEVVQAHHEGVGAGPAVLEDGPVAADDGAAVDAEAAALLGGEGLAGPALHPVRRAPVVLEAREAREGRATAGSRSPGTMRGWSCPSSRLSARTETSVPRSVTAITMPIDVPSIRSSSFAISAITSRWFSRT